MHYPEPSRYEAQAVTSPPMLNALGILEDRLQRLTEVVTELENKLTPILTPDLEKERLVAPDKSPSVSGSSYTQRLVTAYTIVDRLGSRLTQLTRQAEC